MVEQFDIDWMETQFKAPDPVFDEASTLDKSERRRLSELWVKHYLEHNRLEPIEDASGTGSQYKGQASMLLDAGFCEIAVPYRFYLSGLLWAIK